MGYIIVRFALIALCFILGVFFHLQYGLGSAWYLYLGGLVLLLTHLLFGSVWLAFQQIQGGRPEQAAKLLRFVVNPNWLVKANRSYYYFVNGLIAVQAKQLDQAKDALGKALEIGLDRKNDKALALLNLAHIHLVQKDLKGAEKYAELSANTNPSDLMIKDNLQKLQRALSLSKNSN